MAAVDQSVLRHARVLWDYHNTETPLETADAIIGLGSYDLRVADRCAQLFHRGLASRIIFTGASGNWTQGMFPGSEAAAFLQRAVSLDVPGEAITAEEKATNIGENIGFVRSIIPDAQRLIWVTKPQTRRRVSASLAVKWPQVTSMITAPEHSLAEQPGKHHSLEALIAEMVGDVWRMAAYPDTGFQALQPLGADVRMAFDRLVTAGFTNHLPPRVRSLLDR
tara:strand:+ start:4368 stop:5033 length:666 start_codon:yes stop_codon:yes gene_type:complete